MMGIEKHLEKEKTKSTVEPQHTPSVKAIKGTRGDIDDEDDEESYYRLVCFKITIHVLEMLKCLFRFVFYSKYV